MGIDGGASIRDIRILIKGYYMAHLNIERKIALASHSPLCASKTVILLSNRIITNAKQWNVLMTFKGGWYNEDTIEAQCIAVD